MADQQTFGLAPAPGEDNWEYAARAAASPSRNAIATLTKGAKLGGVRPVADTMLEGGKLGALSPTHAKAPHLLDSGWQTALVSTQPQNAHG
jgi:hypothetical protein